MIWASTSLRRLNHMLNSLHTADWAVGWAQLKGTMMRNLLPIIAAGVLAVSATSAQAVQSVNLIKNGSFETVNPALSFNNAGVIQVTGVNTTALTSWSVATNNQYKINRTYDAFDGDNSVDLSGTNGIIFQNVTGLTVGTKYKITFQLSGNPSATVDPRLRLTLTNPTASQDFVFDTPVNQSAGNMGWTRVSYNFVAGAPTTRVTFSNTLPAAARARGAVIDDVFLTVAVPEPATWAMLLIGFGMVGFAARRRNRALAA